MECSLMHVASQTNASIIATVAPNTENMASWNVKETGRGDWCMVNVAGTYERINR